MHREPFSMPLTQEQIALRDRLKQGAVPQHVAIIMDGNGRWAQQRQLGRIKGHKAGIRAVQAAIEAAWHLGIHTLTLYAFSTENWKRPDRETRTLMALLRQFLRIQKPQAARYGIRFRVLGDLSGLDQGLLHDLHRSMAETASFTAMTLNIALNYSGRRDILNAVERIRCHPPQHPLSETDFGRYLSTEGQNDPDLIIRTSGEQRLSNFLLWELAYAEILFLETLWPDFSMDDFFTAVENFQARTRRFGGL